MSWLLQATWAKSNQVVGWVLRHRRPEGEHPKNREQVKNHSTPETPERSNRHKKLSTYLPVVCRFQNSQGSTSEPHTPLRWKRSTWALWTPQSKIDRCKRWTWRKGLKTTIRRKSALVCCMQTCQQPMTLFGSKYRSLRWRNLSQTWKLISHYTIYSQTGDSASLPEERLQDGKGWKRITTGLSSGLYFV